MTVNIWKSCNYVHCSWRNKYGNHPCSYEHCLTSSWNKTWKKFRPERDLKPWSLRYRWSALSSEIRSQLRAGHYVVSDRPSMWWAMTVNIWKLYMCSAVDETNVEIVPALMNTTELLRANPASSMVEGLNLGPSIYSNPAALITWTHCLHQML